MANAKIGSHPSYSYQLVQTLDTNVQLTPSDSGKLFMCVQNGSADVIVKLPSLSADIAGWNAKFILKTSAGNDFGIVGYNSDATVGDAGTSGENDKIVAYEYANDNSGTPSITTTDGADCLYFKATVAEIGNMIEIQTDGTLWYAQAFTRTAADVDVAN